MPDPQKRDASAPLRLVLGELRGADPDSPAVRALAALLQDAGLGLLAELDRLAQEGAWGQVIIEFRAGVAEECRVQTTRKHNRTRRPRQEWTD